jgi:hypothetical protein
LLGATLRAIGSIPEIQVEQTWRPRTAQWEEDVILAGTTSLSEHALRRADDAVLRRSRRIHQTVEEPTEPRDQSCSSKTLVVQLVKSVRVLPQLPSVARYSSSPHVAEMYSAASHTVPSGPGTA